MNSKDKLLREAIKLAVKQGYRNIKREDVAQKAGVSAALINFYYGTIQNLQKEVMRYAVKERVLNLIAQGITLRDKIALNASKEKRKDAAFSLLD